MVHQPQFDLWVIASIWTPSLPFLPTITRPAFVPWRWWSLTTHSSRKLSFTVKVSSKQRWEPWERLIFISQVEDKITLVAHIAYFLSVFSNRSQAIFRVYCSADCIISQVNAGRQGRPLNRESAVLKVLNAVQWYFGCVYFTRVCLILTPKSTKASEALQMFRVCKVSVLTW